MLVGLNGNPVPLASELAHALGGGRKAVVGCPPGVVPDLMGGTGIPGGVYMVVHTGINDAINDAKALVAGQ